MFLETSMEIELTEFQKQIETAVSLTTAPGKHFARNAIRNIKKAWLIKELDREIAVFRTINAEEEAATAIFHALKKRKYPGAEQLQQRNHIHKAAVYPFFIALGFVFSFVNQAGFSLEVIIKKEEKHKIKIRMKTPDGKNYIYPEPPLGYFIKRDGKIYDFLDELNAIAESANLASIMKQIEELANERNKLLYAHQGGILTFNEPVDEIIQDQLNKVFNFLTVYLLVEQYAEHQLFVQQALNAFLTVLGKLPARFDFE